MIGHALKMIRCVYGYKAKEVAEQLNISSGYVSDLESGKKEPSVELLKAFSSFYKLRPSTIMYLAEEIPDENVVSQTRAKLRERVLKTIRILGADIEGQIEADE